jgi:RimJ/RimL family protein N-acetyltransferase
MKPVTLRTPRLVLDQPTLADVDIVTEYCRDPLFERFMSTPWPYRKQDAELFLGQIVPAGWSNDTEYTWSIRVAGGFAGMIGFRSANRDLGFWLGAPYRGRGLMTEAVGGVLDWVFASSEADVLWECYLGNLNSLGVARKSGFTYRGVGDALVADRDGGRPDAWKASIAKTDSRDAKPGWPEG